MRLHEPRALSRDDAAAVDLCEIKFARSPSRRHEEPSPAHGQPVGVEHILKVFNSLCP